MWIVFKPVVRGSGERNLDRLVILLKAPRPRRGTGVAEFLRRIGLVKNLTAGDDRGDSLSKEKKEETSGLRMRGTIH